MVGTERGNDEKREIAGILRGNQKYVRRQVLSFQRPPRTKDWVVGRLKRALEMKELEIGGGNCCRKIVETLEGKEVWKK